VRPTLLRAFNRRHGSSQSRTRAELAGINHWDQQRAAHPEGPAGQGVLIDFWTYPDHCIRTLPYVTDWYKQNTKTRAGRHWGASPEFAFEHGDAQCRSRWRNNSRSPIRSPRTMTLPPAGPIVTNIAGEYFIDAKGNPPAYALWRRQLRDQKSPPRRCLPRRETVQADLTQEQRLRFRRTDA